MEKIGWEDIKRREIQKWKMVSTPWKMHKSQVLKFFLWESVP
jgi:hypothetical protein